MAYDVFISHSSKDSTIAYSIVAGLENHNIRCFIAPRDIQPGDDWISAISQTIIDVPVMLMIFSKNSNHSREVDNEVNLALNHNTVVIPLKIDETSPSLKKEYSLGNVHWLDAPNPLTAKQLQDLLDLIKPLVHREVTDVKTDEKYKKVKPPEEKRPRTKIIAASVIAAAVLITTFALMLNAGVFAFNQKNNTANTPLSGSSSRDDTGSISGSEDLSLNGGAAAEDESVQSLLQLDFDSEDDTGWLSNMENLSLSGGIAHIDAAPGYGGLNFNYSPKNGYVYHVRARSDVCGGVALGPFRLDSCLNSPFVFDVVLEDPEQNATFSTGALNLDGIAILNTGQWLDYILYTSPDGDRVYALIAGEKGNVSYISYEIPAEMRSLELYPVINVFYNQPGEYFEIDSVSIAKGSLKSYLDNNLPAYASNKELIDEFLSQDALFLPEMSQV